MLIQESRRRQEELKRHLCDMATSLKEENEMRDIALKLKGLYSDGFRHTYSEFFAMIVEMARDDNEYDLDYLSNNLVYLRMLVEQDYVDGEKEFRGLYVPLTKLSDHINLEIARYSNSSVHEQRVMDLEKRNSTLQVSLNEATEKLNEAQEAMASVQTELISVLSIFAAIVLAFSGSMSILGNALTGLQNAPFFKSIFFVLLCGFVIANVIFLMMYLVGKITGRNIYARCKTKYCTCGKNGRPKCWGITRVRKRLPYVFWLNFIIFLMMAADLAVWYLDRLYNIIP